MPRERKRAHVGEYLVGQPKVAAGVHHNGSDGQVVRVTDVGKKMVHHLPNQEAKGFHDTWAPEAPTHFLQLSLSGCHELLVRKQTTFALKSQQRPIRRA